MGASDPARFDPVRDITATLLGLSAAAIAMRALIWSPPTLGLAGMMQLVQRALAFSRDDVRISLILAALAGCALLLARRSPRAMRAICAIVLVTACFCAFVYGVNVSAVRWLRGPITYEWLSYADAFQSFSSQAVIASIIDLRAIGSVIASVAILLAVRRASRWTLARVPGRGAWAMLALVLAGLVLLARFDQPALSGPSYGRIVNPLREFSETSWGTLRSPLMTLETPVGDEDFRVGGARGPAGEAGGPRRKRNILVVVLESAPAADVIGGRDGAAPIALPNIAALRASGVTFREVYATYPTSSRTMFALNMSRYPLPSVRPESRTLRDGSFVTIAGRMRQAGYRTAFFLGSDFAYQGLDRFLDGKGFDRMADLRTIACDLVRRPVTQIAGVDDHVTDQCAASALLNWIDVGRGQPFFSIVWTADTHFPYLAGAPDPKGSRAAFVRALQGTDAALGTIVDGLKARHMLDDTLILVLSDHGEAFGKHGMAGHGNSILDEEAHVPLILSNPALFSGQSSNRIGSVIDVAPTILDLVGLPREGSWQGRSLFDLERAPRAYFVVSRKSLIAGYREGRYKFTYDVWQSRARRYDLVSDPQEMNPVVLRGAEELAVKQRIAAWMQYQQRLADRSRDQHP